MNGPDGKWIGWGIGDTDPKVTTFRQFMARKFASYAGDLGDSPVYDQQLADAVSEMQRRYGLPVTGVINYATQVKMGFITPPPPDRPIMFTVEGHLSDMWRGPVADTATILENEGHCWHQPIGYNNGAIPFDNDSGVQQLARLVGATVMDNGRPFPPGTPWSLGLFSQGAIVGFDFYCRYLQPGQPLEWRAKDLRGVLAYGPPCRQQGSAAPWALPWIKNPDSHGLDPYRRFGLPGLPARPAHPWMDVWRTGDIFTDNGNDRASAIKAAVYQAVARGDLFSDPYSLAAQIADLFSVGFDEVFGIVMAIVSGVKFLATHPNPHYDPYDIGGGINWMRDRLTSAAVAA
ncbi:peptidoglycan-binding domain-containing protein [Mycobacterium sp. CSUR Q5927]|nr:peptidoglycan-binding domain-containing protein [Mycobacterium sp. CSUR Q5927]